MLRIGVIGYGYWGPNLVRNFANGARTKVVAIAESAPARRQVAQSQYPYIKVVDDPAALFGDVDIDAVAIATPIFTHFDLSKRALEAGKHVLVEKPPALNAADAEDLVATAEASERVLMPGHLLLYHPAVRAVKQLVG